MAVFPLEYVRALLNLWLSPVTIIPQVGRLLRLIFDFTWSRINEAAKRLSPMEMINFRGAINHILNQVLTAEPEPRASIPLQGRLGQRIRKMWDFQTCTEVLGSLELEILPEGAHPVVSFLCFAAEHSVPIALPQGME